MKIAHKSYLLCYLAFAVLVLPSCNRAKVSEVESAPKEEAQPPSLSFPEEALDRRSFGRVSVARFLRLGKFALAAYRILKDKGDTDAIFDLERAFYDTGAMTISMKRAMADDRVREIVRSRYGSTLKGGVWVPNVPDIDQLIKLPENTLGYSYAKIFKIDNPGFSPDFYQVEKVSDKNTQKDDEAFFMNRTRQIHDIIHLVSGLDPSVEGEHAVQAFILAQIQAPLAIAIIAGDLFYSTFKESDGLCMKLAFVSGGYRYGKKADSVLAQKWEEMWSMDLNELRRKLRIPGAFDLRAIAENQCAE